MPRIERTGQGAAESIRLIDDDSGSQATILPNFGFNCCSFQVEVNGRPREFLWTEPNFPDPSSKASHNGTPILAPFPNRIREGRFKFDGKHYELPRNEHGRNAIHGFVIDQPWRVTEQFADNVQASVAAEFQLSIDRPAHLPLWPADFICRFRYTLSGSSLRTDIEVVNPSNEILPFGVGTHPYFRFPQDPRTPLSECSILAPASRHVELIDYLPTGQFKPVEAAADLRKGMTLDQRMFDDVFTGLTVNDEGIVHYELADHRDGVKLIIEEPGQFPFAVIYTPPHRQSICIEPYSCVTDAINLENKGVASGLWRLKPGEHRQLSVAYRASAI